MSAVSITTTSGAASGDQSAGLALGSEVGWVGKAQPPPPGQTLLFGLGDFGMACDSVQRRGVIAAVVVIALQEFLRKIRIVMLPVLICSRY